MIVPFVFVFLAAIIGSAVSTSFDWNYGNVSLYHSESTYCSIDTYLTRTYKGPLAGFVPVYNINDPKHDTHGYIGYTASQKTIWVAFRGSESFQNWIDNLDAILTTYPLCAKCYVHKGFYDAEQSALPGIVQTVKNLKAKYPDYSVVVTGHSLGAALATLVSLDLLNQGVTKVRLFNFGSPRVGDTTFATWASSVLTDRNRITHHKDMVPHCPMHERFTHISGEWYEPDDTVKLNACTGFEDPTCSYQWSVTSIDDHLYYLGLTMGTGGCSAIL